LSAAHGYRKDAYERELPPKIGDPTIAGWVTVVLYLLAAGSCWISAQKLGLEDVGLIVIGIDPHPFAPIPKRKRR